MEPKKPKSEDFKSEEKLKSFLRSTGRMFPETPEQVEAFERRHRKNVKLPDLLTDPIAMLRRGYINPQVSTKETSDENNEGHSMAARQGLNLSADTLQKMKEDRHKAEENARLRQSK